ncbi:hypothetical protein HGP14_14930 [Rhizobium sp. P32RR-XVIII]|uniref:hypothetical protein n=1 Tax=Rhizobium sp. P32RR-XVIII TaxID=2726738 RepID=UPI0014568797|nr:hypothetical protein [Rhizobium sp. P32RR-XVIII]NLS04650.1 hypothetical protein [Rhizobium sp. P32RR-XVIII]
MHRSSRCLFAAAAFMSLALPAAASAESFPSLAEQGYSVSVLGPGKFGGLGWVVSKGNEQFFCRIRASLAYVGEKDMVSFSKSGRIVTLNRAVFESSLGRPDSTLPQLADLQAGHPRPADVGTCSPLAK